MPSMPLVLDEATLRFARALCPLGPRVENVPWPTRLVGPLASALPMPWRLATDLAAAEVWVPLLDGDDSDGGLCIVTSEPYWSWWQTW